MSNINISITEFTGEDADSYNVRYARIDNTDTPVYLSAGNKTGGQFPFSIADVENGRYAVGITPVYADARSCPETFRYSNGCSEIIALNAVQDDSGNLQITYTAPGNVPQVLLKVYYPNGGSYVAAYTNGANDSRILISIPTGVNGDYTVYMQSICDPDTGFYSTATPPVTVAVGTTTVDISSSAAGTVITAIYGIDSYILSGELSPGGRDTGTHGGFTGVISATFRGTPAVPCSASLTVNGGTPVCVDLPDTDGGSVSFPSAVYYATDIINISFNLGEC